MFVSTRSHAAPMADAAHGRRVDGGLIVSRTFLSSNSFVAVAALIILSFVLAGCGDDDDEQAATTEGQEAVGQPVTGEFVGRVEGRDDFLVAVVTEGEGDSRTVKVYVCSEEEQVAEWFPGSPTEENVIDLESEDGDSQAEVTLTAGGANGTVTLADGKPLDFEAAPAQGIGGLYDVTISEDGKLSGKDPVSGATTEGQVSSEPTGEKPFVYPVRQSYTAPDGESVKVRSGATELVTGKLRCIVVDPDGEPGTPDALAIGKAVLGTAGYSCRFYWD